MEPSDPDPLVGALIGDRYRIRSRLGAGGMGTIYRAEHTMMKKEVALKLLHAELSRLEEVARRFEREAEAAARLDHPNIITVTDFGRTADGLLFLVMELLEGQSLAEAIGRESAARRWFGIERSQNVLRQILRALEHAHASGIVHRDLKPENIMLIERDGERDIVKLLDFGIAKMISGPSSTGQPALTQAGVVFGTPEYLSPEQAMGEEADGRADLYAAGVIFYELLTGRRPFISDSKVAVVSMHLTQKALPVTQAAPEAHIPHVIEEVVERAMQKRREDRYATAADFLQALDRFGTGKAEGVRAAAQAPNVGNRARSTWIPSLRASVDGVVRKISASAVRSPRASFIFAGLFVVALLLLLFRSGHRPAAIGGVAASASQFAEQRLQKALERLHSGRSCKERKAAALELIATGDSRYAEPLRAARDRRGGFLGLERSNGCMVRELEAALRRIEPTEK